MTNSPDIDSAVQSPRSGRRSPSRSRDNFASAANNADKDGSVSQVSGISASLAVAGAGNLPTPAQSRVDSYEQLMGQGQVLFTPATPPPGLADSNQDDDAEILVGQHNELEEKEMFSKLEKPRVRYDVEVVTKLVVYTGKSLYIELVSIANSCQESHGSPLRLIP